MKLQGLIWGAFLTTLTLLLGCGITGEYSQKGGDSNRSSVLIQEQIPIYAELEFAQMLFNAVNEERAQQGLFPLIWHDPVANVAKFRSKDMASRNYFSHKSPEGETAFSLLDRYGIPHSWAGENLARNNYPDNQTVGVAIRDLMASEGHQENILSGNYTHLGVGAVEDSTGMKYYTMIFISPP